MKSFVWISDVHFTISTLTVATQVMRQALEEARRRGLPLVVSGDLNDTKAILRSEVIRAILQIFKEYEAVPIYVLIGNHDLDNERNMDHHCLNFLSASVNVTIVDKPRREGDWFMLPYQNSAEKFMTWIQACKTGGMDKLICHQGFFGAKMGNYAVDQTSVSPLEMQHFKIVLTGHYHEHQRVGLNNIIYCGSPYTVTFAEAGQKKFFHIVNEDLSLESIETGARRHVSIDYSQKMSPTCPDPTLVKVREEDLLRVQLFGERAWINSFTKEKLAEVHGTKNISLVPKPERQSRDRLEVKNLSDVSSVVKSYMTTAQTDLDKDKLMLFYAKELM